MSHMLRYALAHFWESTYKLDRVVQLTFIVSMALNLLVWILLYIKISPYSYLTESGTIPLHYNLYFGIDVFGKWYSVFAMPIVGLLVVVVNNTLAYLLYQREPLVSRVLLYTQVMVSAIIFAAAIFVVLLNL